MLTKKIIWLSFDLGLRGDYEGLYAWLDQRGARECGDGVATLRYEHDGKTLPSRLKEDLEKSVTFDKHSRMYVIFRNNEHHMKGRFIVGSRKTAPWVGMGTGVDSEDDEE